MYIHAILCAILGIRDWPSGWSLIKPLTDGIELLIVLVRRVAIPGETVDPTKIEKWFPQNHSSCIILCGRASKWFKFLVYGMLITCKNNNIWMIVLPVEVVFYYFSSKRDQHWWRFPPCSTVLWMYTFVSVLSYYPLQKKYRQRPKKGRLLRAKGRLLRAPKSRIFVSWASHRRTCLKRMLDTGQEPANLLLTEYTKSSDKYSIRGNNLVREITYYPHYIE